ncbi:conserved protein of unknown function [Blastococcus saxobsidens DD2]|uniref:Uncharacterized protein n=1 Tax=Blastococcus saxobsidens (strain DD2) TaxID=1146883 RepID=H6RSM0_BLASD|nr:conserved protein of unknown function [Blastococcus saxobsidens DD2]
MGLWTAGWLALLLVLGMVRFGDPALQWPVLLVPALWALAALRPRRSAGPPPARPRRRVTEDGWADDEWREDEWREDEWREDERPEDEWVEDPRARGATRLPPGERTDTVERPALRRRSDGTGHR